ncbi:MAG TPA: sulfotransferase [Planctomycetaceae bacterium]|nr:sulfotransferase [Planctomycetaceae bacterium]HQZ65214.1 sulfotransferase [Planctomycetaceae bacterium]HRA87096.1 sulfotransferase [Planctomycetaceae bacterium]
MNAEKVPVSNFKNPVGLLFRMLLSGRRAAYSALIHEAMRLASRPLNFLLAGRERRLREASSTTSAPVILVVGAPRSGTTLVYQTLARYLDTTYFSNLTSLFPDAPLAGTRMFRWLPQRQSADFQNFYGQTAGLNGPNDGFTIWNQWLGEDRYVPRTDLTADEERAMAQFFKAWCATFEKPFLNKNNRNTGCLNLLCRAIPQSSFVVVRRNPLLVAQSLINARLQVQGDKSVGWGLHSQSSDTAADPLAYVDDVCDQVLQIEAELDDQLRHVPENRIVEITYEGFCETPEDTLRWIVSRIPGVQLREDLIQSELSPFAASAKLTLSEPEKERLLSRLRSSGRTRALVH